MKLYKMHHFMKLYKLPPSGSHSYVMYLNLQQVQNFISKRLSEICFNKWWELYEHCISPGGPSAVGRVVSCQLWVYRLVLKATWLGGNIDRGIHHITWIIHHHQCQYQLTMYVPANVMTYLHYLHCLSVFIQKQHTDTYRPTVWHVNLKYRLYWTGHQYHQH